MAGYAEGSITRIKMQNFMAYSNMEIYPKKGLNLIIGKNGSGKSSIMCAICLGLGGKPQFTGRSTKLLDFIKHGCNKAEIEIELKSKKRTVIICRKINRKQCEWYLNKSPSNQNKIESVVKKFNIDTSNICQFLFQDSEFSKMDKKKKLQNMLQAIGEPHLFELYNELKDLSMKVSEVEQNMKGCKKNRDSIQTEIENIKNDMEKQEKRCRLKNQLKQLYDKKEKCMKIEEYNEVCEAFRKQKAKKQTLLKGVKKLHLERKKAVIDENDILNSYAQYSRKFQEYKLKKIELMNKLKHNTNAITSFEEEVNNQKMEYKNKLMDKEVQRNRLYDINKQIEVLELQLAEEVNKFTNSENNVQLDSQALVQLQSEIDDLNKKSVKASVEKNGLEHAANELQSQLNSLQDENIRKLKILEQYDKPTYEGAYWLMKNKIYFKCNVYLPIMFEIKMISNEYSKYLENIIPFKDMIAFVCENKSDSEHLTEILKHQMKLPVNIVIAPETPLSLYVSPPLTLKHRLFGLECFVKDLFTAPEAVMKYLCHYFHIHCIPVSKSIVSSNNIDLILQEFKIFCFENVKISSKRSKYGKKNLSIRRDFIMPRNLLVDHNDELQKSVEQKVQEITESVESIERQLDEYNADVVRKQKLLLGQRRRTKELESELLQKVKYRSLISVVIDVEVEKGRTTKIIQSINESRATALYKRNSLLMDFIQLEKEIVKVILNMNFLSKKLKTIRKDHQDLYDRIKDAETDFKTIKEQFSQTRKYGSKLAIEIKLFKMQYDEVLSVDDLDERIYQIEAELNFDDDNEHVLIEYCTKTNKMDGIQHEIDKFKDNLHKMKEVLEAKKNEWLTPVQHHIRNINKKFSHYFKQMNCAGEISLDVPDNLDDFTQYGLQIQLKFRDTDEFTELSCRQSGGEASLATVLFILSLQKLRKVPFRCIDEFSQHMDPNTERKVYQFIFDSRKYMCSQYFLITPELLLNFKYPDDVTFHMIFNSCFAESTLDVKKGLNCAELCRNH